MENRTPPSTGMLKERYLIRESFGSSTTTVVAGKDDVVYGVVLTSNCRLVISNALVVVGPITVKVNLSALGFASSSKETNLNKVLVLLRL